MEKINKNIKDKIMSIIKMRHIEPESKSSLALKACFQISFLILISVLAIIVLSFIGFISHTSIELLVLFAVLAAGLYILLANKESLSDIPRLYTLIAMLMVLILISFIINTVQMHRHIMKRTKHMTSMRMMYERYEPKILHDMDIEGNIESTMK